MGNRDLCACSPLICSTSKVTDPARWSLGAGAGLTLGNEIDKLAGNIALGRDAAGVHYRSDSVRGLFVGEQQALGLLRDYSRTYSERFDGFIVRRFNGDQVTTAGGEVRPL